MRNGAHAPPSAPHPRAPVEERPEFSRVTIAKNANVDLQALEVVQVRIHAKVAGVIKEESNLYGIKAVRVAGSPRQQVRQGHHSMRDSDR